MHLHKGEKRRKSWPEKCLELAQQAIDWIICIYLLLMLVVLPFYNEEGYNHIATDKSVFFRRVSLDTGKILLLPLLFFLILRIILSVKNRTKIRFKIPPTDFLALLYCAALFLSYAFTDYRENTLWGEAGWFMGLIPQLILMGIYFLVSRFWTPRKWMFYTVFPVSGAVFLMGCLNRFGIYSFGMDFANVVFISTIGNINWYCGYAVSVVFMGVVLIWMGERLKIWQRAALMLYAAVGYLSLVLQGSDSGLATLAVVMIVLFAMSAKDSGRMFAFWQEMTLLWGECLGICIIRHILPDSINYVGVLAEIFISTPVSIGMTAVSVAFLGLMCMDRKNGRYREKLFRCLAAAAVATGIGLVIGNLLLAVLNALYPGLLGGLSDSVLFLVNRAMADSRGSTWRSGWECFAAQDVLHKLAGVGPDGMWSYISSGSNPELLLYVQAAFDGLRLTNAHSEWLTILVNTGLLGLIGYGGMMVCGMWELFRKSQEKPLALACGFCLLAYTVNNIFSFQQSMSAGTIFVLFAMALAYRRKS